MNRYAADRTTLPERRASLAVLLVFATLGTLLGVAAAGDNELRFDITVLEAIQRIDLPAIDSIVRFSNTVFGTVPALVLAMTLIAVAAILGLRLFVLQMAVVMVLRIAGQVLKPIFDSPRPGVEYQPDPSLVSDSLGYPSGHAFTATVMMVMLVVFVHSFEMPRWARVASIVVAVIATMIALFSRVMIGAHWPTDTIGGVCFGLATVALMQLIVGAIIERRTAATTEALPTQG